MAEPGNYPQDVDGYFRMLVEQAWEKANKRQRIKAKQINKMAISPGLEDIVENIKNK